MPEQIALRFGDLKRYVGMDEGRDGKRHFRFNLSANCLLVGYLSERSTFFTIIDMPRRDPAKLTKVSVGLPFNLGNAEWTADLTERRAAWTLYVQLVTRIAVQELHEDTGMLREALTSLHQLFPTTRETLCTAGPDVGATIHSLGGIAIAVLNRGLRPFLSKWHPRLLHWEAQRSLNVSPLDHEAAWPEAAEFRNELAQLRQQLERYAVALAEIAGVRA